MSARLSVSDLASRLNLQRAVRGYRGTCPACGYPNAFALKPGKADRIRLFCASCGDRAAIAVAIVRAAGGAWRPPAEPISAHDPAGRQRQRDRALRLWNGSVPAVGTVADIYLAGRALAGLATSPSLRFRADCPYIDGYKLPALMAEVVGADGAFVALHRTFLRPDGNGKAEVETPRASLGSPWGGAIRLDATAETLVIGEGIETAASAGRLLGIPAWAAVSAGNLAQGMVLPTEVRSVVIAVDADPAGKRAARSAAIRWRGEGRSIQLASPDNADCDFNDILRGGKNA